MSVAIIELNDSEIRVARGTKIVLRTPGYAVVKPDKLEIGDSAMKIARLNPRGTYNQFWSNLNQDVLPLTTSYARHHADLAYAQLLSIHEQGGKPQEVVFAVPGSHSNEQLSILLGIVAACPFTPVGLVDSAVACAAAVAGPGHYLHMDLHLHQTVFTQIDVTDQVVRGSVETIDNGGLTAIHDAVAALIADTFIQHCRFDPLRHAETEQVLYDQIPRCLQALSTKMETQIEIRFQHTRHQVKLGRAAMLEKLEVHYAGAVARLTTGDRAPLLSDRVAALPGFADQVPYATVLEAEAVFRGCELHHQVIRSSPPNMSFVTRLPVSAQPLVTKSLQKPVQRQNAPIPSATHLLLGHQAFPVGAAPLYAAPGGSVSRSRHPTTACSIALNSHAVVITPLGDSTVFVNNERLSKPGTLLAGDQISFAGSDTVYSMICVAGHDGA